ncbi:MAG TPA: hypothetical protein VF239_03990 [Vicinamibacterales bacterium]
MPETSTHKAPESASARASAKAEIRDLAELIAALDRRVPRIERNGEATIVRAAATLKSEAIKRIAVLEQRLR